MSGFEEQSQTDRTDTTRDPLDVVADLITELREVIVQLLTVQKEIAYARIRSLLFKLNCYLLSAVILIGVVLAATGYLVEGVADLVRIHSNLPGPYAKIATGSGILLFFAAYLWIKEVVIERVLRVKLQQDFAQVNSSKILPQQS